MIQFSSHFQWAHYNSSEDESICSRLPIQFNDMFNPKSKPFEVIGLVSYPSSGNSWLRYLIEGVSGIYTGSLYNDQSLKREGKTNQ